MKRNKVRNIIFLVSLTLLNIVSSSSCNILEQSWEQKSGEQTKCEAQMKLLGSSVHNFGDVNRKGGDLRYKVEFINSGDAPLVVTHCSTGCTCVKAKFPRKPIAPHKKGVIEITYEIHKKEVGAFTKVIQVYSNSKEKRTIITIQGNSIDTKA